MYNSPLIKASMPFGLLNIANNIGPVIWNKLYIGTQGGGGKRHVIRDKKNRVLL